MEKLIIGWRKRSTVEYGRYANNKITIFSIFGKCLTLTSEWTWTQPKGKNDNKNQTKKIKPNSRITKRNHNKIDEKLVSLGNK